MESLSLGKAKRVLVTLRQIESSIILLQDWNNNVQSPDEYLLSSDGMKNLAATCMLVEAVGEAFVKEDMPSLLDATRFFMSRIVGHQ